MCIWQDLQRVAQILISGISPHLYIYDFQHRPLENQSIRSALRHMFQHHSVMQIVFNVLRSLYVSCDISSTGRLYRLYVVL